MKVEDGAVLFSILIEGSLYANLLIMQSDVTFLSVKKVLLFVNTKGADSGVSLTGSPAVTVTKEENKV
jgi:hypothetical protein